MPLALVPGIELWPAATLFTPRLSCLSFSLSFGIDVIYILKYMYIFILEN
jgi:hypothetical protein